MRQPGTKPADCMYARGLKLNVVTWSSLVGDDLAYTISLEGVISLESLGSNGPSGEVYGCVAKLSGTVPPRTLTGSYCSQPLTQTF